MTQTCIVPAMSLCSLIRGFRQFRILAAILLVWVSAGVSGQSLRSGPPAPVLYPEGIAENPELPADIGSAGSAWLLFDAESGQILMSRDPDRVIPPASLTKLVTMAVIRSCLDEGGISLDDKVHVRPEGWAVNAPPRSSLMFLGPEQDPTWKEILLGLAVDSGNDAAVAVAMELSGSISGFARRMNDLCRNLGMVATTFVEPSGYSERNLTTPRDFCRFLDWYLRSWPENLKEYHSVPSFTYPSAIPGKGILQYNRNRLLKTYEGADGLKTGFIDESGYNLAFTASRGGMRLAGVVLGAPDEAGRNREATWLMDQGFSRWEARTVEIPGIGGLRVWSSHAGSIATAPVSCRILLPAGEWQGLVVDRDIPGAVRGPWGAGVPVGVVALRNASGKTLAELSIHLAAPLNGGNAVQRWGDELAIWGTGLLGLAAHPRDESWARDAWARFLPLGTDQ